MARFLIATTRSFFTCERTPVADSNTRTQRRWAIRVLVSEFERGERATSASPAATGTPERDYRGFLSLVSHEFFHLWNVKRIRPDALGPFDYTKENYTKLLWVAEGITDYYADLVLRRAGLIS